MTLEVLPGLLMALPAAQGGFILSFRAYAERLQELGLAIPDAMPVVLALAATTFLAALGTVVENTVSAEEVVRATGGPIWGVSRTFGCDSAQSLEAVPSCI